MLPTSMNDCGCESSILIVDDNCFNLIPLELILRENFNLHCDKALNGLEAVKMFTHYNKTKTCCKQRYQLILMDLNMPIMDGYQATREIMKLHR